MCALWTTVHLDKVPRCKMLSEQEGSDGRARLVYDVVRLLQYCLMRSRAVFCLIRGLPAGYNGVLSGLPYMGVVWCRSGRKSRQTS